MAVRVAGLAFGGGAEHGGDVVVAFDVGLLREIQIAAVRLRFAGECGFQIFLGPGAFQIAHDVTSWRWLEDECAPRPAAVCPSASASARREWGN